ncbi:hypothetical protein [Polaromonas naphthalenivorans]|uniref:hypothetical protein n=1 Tax=Polaromonas naphthalenivorans TaxID=216465 RepID=UPI001E6314BC|nr:hypothetical protein [Polaromonas naphthalenivorans]
MSDKNESISINRRGWLAMGIASAGATGLATTGARAATGNAAAAPLVACRWRCVLP